MECTLYYRISIYGVLVRYNSCGSASIRSKTISDWSTCHSITLSYVLAPLDLAISSALRGKNQDAVPTRDFCTHQENLASLNITVRQEKLSSQSTTSKQDGEQQV